MKQTLLFLLALLPSAASADAVEIDGVYYNLILKGKVAEVTKKPSGYYTGSIVIPDSVDFEGEIYPVTSIGDFAFYECSELLSITIPNTVTSIGELAFYYCSGLTSVNIPNSVIDIGRDAFYYCVGLTSITIPNSVKNIGNGAFGNCSSLTSLTIPNSVKSIGDSAFLQCYNLTSLTIPDSVTSIGNYAFYLCYALTSVSIPSSVTIIGSAAFYGCYNLADIIIPNSVTYLGGSIFYNCSSLTNITIPSSVTYLGGNAFYGCTGLTNITIPNSVTTIEKETFSGCTGLTSVTIPSSVTKIGSWAFYECRGLKSVDIPKSVTSIGEKAFASIPDLTDVYCYAETVPYTISNLFKDSYAEYATLHVPATAINDYKSTEPWSGFNEIVPIEDITIEKCATPVITFKDGKVMFSCETEDVEFVYEITNTDVQEGSGTEVSLGTTYQVSVYAKKDGYENSSVATAFIDASGLKGDLNNDGTVDIQDMTLLIEILLGR